ncbi:MAG: alpha-ribazole phosphatase [Thermodesulfovibrionales bacterium]
MVTTLYLIRHGETEGSDVKRYKGSIDIPLSERGVEQMEQVARYLNRPYNGLKAVYCSPLIRAIRSAEIISEPYGLRPIAVPDLRERSFGIWEGMSFDEIRERYPEEFEAWASNPLKYSPMGGESTLEVRDRVMNALHDILSNHDAERIAIVAHGGVNRIILCHYMGVPLENIFRIEQDYAAVNIIEFHDGYPVVRLINGVFYG